MVQTLKQVYQHKKLLLTKDKIVEAQLAILGHKEATTLINEAIEENLDDVQAVIEKLRLFEDIINSDPSDKKNEMTKILQDQMDEINAAVAKDKKGGLAGLFQSLMPAENPVNKALVFISALETGFKSLPTIVKNNLRSAGDPANSEKSIDELTTNTGDPKLVKAGENIRKSFIKAFVTKGKLNSLKFDPNKAGLSDFIFGLTTLRLQTLENLAKQLNTGPQATAAADNAEVTTPPEDAETGNDKAQGSSGPFDKIKNKIAGSKSFDELINSVKSLGAGTKISLASGQKIVISDLLSSLEKIKKDPKAFNDENKLKTTGITQAGGLRKKVLELIQGGGEKSSEKAPAVGQPPADKEQKQQLVTLTQNKAKEAGITDADSIQALMDKLDYKVGSLEGALVVPELQKLQRKFNIPEDQTSGFIRGLMLSFEDDFKVELQNSIGKEIERIKKEREAKKQKGEKTQSVASELEDVMK